MSRNRNYYESTLNESYKDFDARTITSYVKNFVKHVKDYEDVSEFLDSLNEYLEPLNVEVVDEFGGSGYKWITPNIAFASVNEVGTISIEIGAETLLQDLIWDRENNYPYEKDTDFNQFLKELGQVIVHECVHAHQYSKGYPNKKWENSDPSEVGMWKYLANNDEVDAHAIAGVQEALDIGYSKKEILDILSGKNKDSKAEDLIHELNCTTDYYDWFCDSDDPRDQKVIKRLVKVMANEALKED